MQKYSRRNAKLRAIETLVNKQGLKIVCLVRLGSLTPFGLSNYIFGTTSVRYREFALGTFCLLPGTLLNTYIGTTIESIKDAVSAGETISTLHIVIYSVTTAFSIIGLIVFSVYAKR